MRPRFRNRMGRKEGGARPCDTRSMRCLASFAGMANRQGRFGAATSHAALIFLHMVSGTPIVARYGTTVIALAKWVAGTFVSLPNHVKLRRGEDLQSLYLRASRSRDRGPVRDRAMTTARRYRLLASFNAPVRPKSGMANAVSPRSIFGNRTNRPPPCGFDFGNIKLSWGGKRTLEDRDLTIDQASRGLLPVANRACMGPSHAGD